MANADIVVEFGRMHRNCDARLAEQGRRIEQLETENRQMEARITTQGRRIEQLETKVRQMEARITVTEQVTAQMTIQMSQMENRINDQLNDMRRRFEQSGRQRICKTRGCNKKNGICSECLEVS